MKGMRGSGSGSEQQKSAPLQEVDSPPRGHSEDSASTCPTGETQRHCARTEAADGHGPVSAGSVSVSGPAVSQDLQPGQRFGRRGAEPGAERLHLPGPVELPGPAGGRAVLPGGGPVPRHEPWGRVVVRAQDRHRRPGPGPGRGSGELPGQGGLPPDATVSEEPVLVPAEPLREAESS